jgi:hypothetical protein
MDFERSRTLQTILWGSRGGASRAEAPVAPRRDETRTTTTALRRIRMTGSFRGSGSAGVSMTAEPLLRVYGARFR